MPLLGGPPRVVNIGVDLFATTLAARDVPAVHVDWRPPAGGDPRLAAVLARLDRRREAIDRANATALERLTNGAPFLVDCRPAREALDLPDRTVLHSGPPIAWERISKPVRGAILGAIRYEGWAANDDAARELVERGDVRLDPCHHHAAAGPMAGVLTPSMPVFVVENRAYGTRGHATINEGLGKVLRYGAHSADVLERLRWMEEALGPALGRALREAGGLDVRALIAQAVQMGDECHNRNRAASALLLKALAPHVAALDRPAAERARLLAVPGANDHFFLNVAMAACKAALDAAHGVPRSTLVTAMARNGTDFGIRVSGLGDRWFTAPAETPIGLYFAGFGAGDANPDIGDSAITETAGLGGFAMAGAPAIVEFVGGTPADALAATRLMYEITLGESDAYRLPALDFRGTPTGIDLRLVVQTGVLPQINTGIAHRAPGIGQIGAGLVKPPIECFEAALRAFGDA